jgi:hypothetical protein
MDVDSSLRPTSPPSLTHSYICAHTLCAAPLNIFFFLLKIVCCLMEILCARDDKGVFRYFLLFLATASVATLIHSLTLLLFHKRKISWRLFLDSYIFTLFFTKAPIISPCIHTLFLCVAIMGMRECCWANIDD